MDTIIIICSTQSFEFVWSMKMYIKFRMPLVFSPPTPLLRFVIKKLYYNCRVYVKRASAFLILFYCFFLRFFWEWEWKEREDQSNAFLNCCHFNWSFCCCFVMFICIRICLCAFSVFLKNDKLDFSTSKLRSICFRSKQLLCVQTKAQRHTDVQSTWIISGSTEKQTKRKHVQKPPTTKRQQARIVPSIGTA